MKIMHLCLSCFYIDGYSYQENLFPKYHKKMGHQVKILASLMSFDETGKTTYLPAACEYVNEDGIPVRRLEYRCHTRLGKIFRKYRGTYEEICAFEPDCLFIHGVQFSDINVIKKYAKHHPDLKIYVDNHADYSNSATNFISKNILHKIIWRRCAKKIEPYTEKFYGVLPARVDFLKELYKLPPEKCELLVMGADDELVEKAARDNSGKALRQSYGIEDNDFLIVTGGKIDLFKKQTLMLMEAVNDIANPRIKLLVFGSVVPELKEEFDALVGGNVIYAGWIASSVSYEYFAAADLAVFPGRHSVFWEQVVGQGIPMIAKHWNGTTHVDIGGNVEFLYNDSPEEIKEKIAEIYENKEKYEKMKKIAVENGMKHFSYREISKRAIHSD